jgi:hypothetical protein
MKIVTRNLLSELLVEAFDHSVAVAALRCLAAYCQTIRETPPAMAVDRFLVPAPESERERVAALLEKSPLLSWDLRGRPGRVTLAPAFTPECDEITAKLRRYDSALAEWVADDTAPPLAIALCKGALLFNHHLFFEVHEILEAQWIEETGAERRFLQGLIQVAVAFYHRENNNFRGTLSLLQDGLGKIIPYQPEFLGVALTDFVNDLEACRDRLLQLGPEGLAQFPADMIPRMQLTQENANRGTGASVNRTT